MWIQLVGERGESGQIQIKPGYGPNDKFEKGRIYKVVARVADIGRVSSGLEIPGQLNFPRKYFVKMSLGMPPIVLRGVEWKVQLWIESQCLTIQMRLVDIGFEIFHLSCACAFKIFFPPF